jgi:hypothetical protein
MKNEENADPIQVNAPSNSSKNREKEFPGRNFLNKLSLTLDDLRISIKSDFLEAEVHCTNSYFDEVSKEWENPKEKHIKGVLEFWITIK